MVMTGPPRIYEFAEKVLKPEILYEINRTPELNRYGMAILDRWAYYQPEELKKLEQQGGYLGVICEVLTQQRIEEEVLERNEHHLANGLVAHEIFEMYEIQTELIL